MLTAVIVLSILLVFAVVGSITLSYALIKYMDLFAKATAFAGKHLDIVEDEYEKTNNNFVEYVYELYLD